MGGVPTRLLQHCRAGMAEDQWEFSPVSTKVDSCAWISDE
jgi:hypothetical protein